MRVIVFGFALLAAVSCEPDTPAFKDRPNRTQPESERGAGGGSTSSDIPDLADNEAFMSRAEYGRDWPLTVPSGIVRCEGAGEVYFEAEGTTYAVNGLALGRDRAPEIDRIWAPDPDFKGLKIDIGPIIDRGLDLCE